MVIELEDSLDIKVYCDNEICSHNGREMKYEEINQEPHTLRIHSMCVGCFQKIKILVKI